MDVNAYNALQAQKQMAFQERMSNTAHQREVRDLQLAGLNPVLSAGGSGASTPTGAMSQAEAESFNSAAAVRGLIKEVNKGNQDTIKTLAQVLGTHEDAGEIAPHLDRDLVAANQLFRDYIEPVTNAIDQFTQVATQFLPANSKVKKFVQEGLMKKVKNALGTQEQFADNYKTVNQIVKTVKAAINSGLTMAKNAGNSSTTSYIN